MRGHKFLGSPRSSSMAVWGNGWTIWSRLPSIQMDTVMPNRVQTKAAVARQKRYRMTSLRRGSRKLET